MLQAQAPDPAVTTRPRSTDRGLRLLRLVADHRNGVSLSDVARAAELSASTALRQLRSLEAEGFVSRDDDQRYRPGPELLRIAADLVGGTELVDRATPVLRHLAVVTGESSYVAEPASPAEASYIAAEEGRHAVRHVSWLGRRVSRHGTAIGAALAADVDELGTAVRRDVVESGVTAVAAPIYVGDEVVAAVSVIAPTYRLFGETLDTVRAHVHAAATSLTTP